MDKLTDEQKVKRAVTRENNRRRKEAPLFVFAGLLPETTLREETVRLQLAAAMAAENCGTLLFNRLMGQLEEKWLARQVKAKVGAQEFADLADYNYGTYPSWTYWCLFWRTVLQKGPEAVKERMAYRRKK